MRLFTLFIISLFSCLASYGQDMITIRSGDTIKAKVTKVTPTKVEYKHNEHSKETFSLQRNMLSYIFYKNGTIDTFIHDGPLYTYQEVNVSQSERLATKGMLDAQAYYTGYRPAKGWTTFLTIYLSPIYGLVPAIAFSSSKPSIYNLDIPNRQLLDYESYRNAYEQQAFQIKKKQVWRGYRNGSIAYIALVALAFSAVYLYHQ